MTETHTDPAWRSSREDAERGERGLIVSRGARFVTASRVEPDARTRRARLVLPWPSDVEDQPRELF